jgi:hypothetical protein
MVTDSLIRFDPEKGITAAELFRILASLYFPLREARRTACDHALPSAPHRSRGNDCQLVARSGHGISQFIPG